MKQIQVIDIKHKEKPTYKFARRIKLAMKCLSSKQVALTYEDNASGVIHTRYINYAQKDIGYILVTIGQSIYDSACALEEAEKIIKKQNN